MGGVADFIASFHNLEGDLIGERKKNLYKLLKKPSLFSNEQEINEALQKLVPETYQESVFYLEALIYFKRTEKLLEILKGGNQLFATKILKQPWFFEQAFKNIEAGELVNEFLPYFSYVVRKKLLSRIAKCWDEKKMDELFNALDKCYGLTEAVDILHKCSPGKIISVLEENEIKLRPNQVIQLCSKGDEILKIYLNHFKKNTKAIYAEQKVINFIALNKPKLLIELEKNETIIVNTIGRRTTKTIMKTSKDEISTDIKRYTNFLNKHVVVKKCSPDFKTVYKTVFPDKFNDVNWDNCDLIYYYPKNRRWNLFVGTFLDKFPRKSVTDILPSFDDDSIKKIEPPKDVIQQWAKILYETSPSQHNYLKYYPTTDAIRIIKEKISVTSDKYKRRTLVELLLETCADNKDMDLLEEVLKYISERHKNEDPYFRNNLLEKIGSLFDLKELKGTHWKYIHEQIRILKLQEELFLYVAYKVIMKHLEFLLKTKKDYKLIFGFYMDDLLGEESYTTFKLEDSAVEKEIYCGMSKVFPDIVKKDDENYVNDVISLISKLISFSLQNKEFCIELKNYPYLVEQIIKCFKNDEEIEQNEQEIIVKTIIYNETFPQYAVDIDDSMILETFSYITKERDTSIWWFKDVLVKFVNKKDRSDLGNKLLKLYMEGNEKSLDDHIILWLLKNDPKTLDTYLDIILNNITSEDGYFLDAKILKQYSHLDLDRKVGDSYKKYLETIDKTEDSIISKLLEGLLELLPTEEFIKIVEENYLPKKDKLDLEDEEMRELYKIQTDLAKKLAKIAEPFKMLPTIMKFCKGDFLPISLAALYSAFYKSPQRILYPFIERLSKQAVSARKHAIFLSCAVLDKEHTLNFLMTRNEHNVSSQKYLFSATLKYFVKNPSQELLDKVIENMSTIDKNDTETLDSLNSVHIPTKYRHTYIEKCWKFFENLKSLSGIKVKEYLEKLLDYMCEEILVTLSKEFVSYILNRYFPLQGNERFLRVNNFAIAVLKNRKIEREEYFKLVFGIVSTFKRHLRYEFFKTFINNVHHDDIDKDFIRLFSNNWTKYFTIIQTLQEHIRMKLLLLRVDNPDIEKYAVTVVDYLDQLISDLSYLVISTFKEELVGTLQPLDMKDKLHFYRAVLKHKQNSTTCIMIIQIIDNMDENDDYEDEDIKQVYNDIKAILQTVNEPVVIACYKSKLADTN